MSLAKNLTSVLANTASERPVCAWLKRNPQVISHAVDPFPRKVVAEFPFGSDFRADFVTLSPFSGGWDVRFVELEPPGAALFTKKGAPAKRLNGAVAQIDAWRSFIESNRQSVLRDLAKFAQKRELIDGPSEYEPIDNVGWPLYHPSSALSWHFHIVMGRRKLLTEVQIGKKAIYFNNHRIGIMTYDRLLEAAKKLDDYRKAGA